MDENCSMELRGSLVFYGFVVVCGGFGCVIRKLGDFNIPVEVSGACLWSFGRFFFDDDCVFSLEYPIKKGSVFGWEMDQNWCIKSTGTLVFYGSVVVGRAFGVVICRVCDFNVPVEVMSAFVWSLRRPFFDLDGSISLENQKMEGVGFRVKNGTKLLAGA